MNLGELKKSLSRFPPDMDDTEVLLHFVGERGELDADCLAFIAVASFHKSDSTAVLLGGWKAVDQVKEKFPEDYKTHSDFKPKNQNTDTNEES